MKKHFLFICLICITSFAFAQETITAEKEIISLLKFGTADTFENLVGYEAVGDSELIDRFPHGPFIDKNGVVYFEFNQAPYKTIKYQNNKFELSKESAFDKRFTFPLSGQNLNGITLSSNFVYFFTYAGNKVKTIDDFINNSNISSDDLGSASIKYYPISGGILIENVSVKNGPYQIGVETKSDYSTNVISKDKSAEWIKTLRGNYSISRDKKVLRNNFQWTPQKQYGMGSYVARLKSGHTVYTREDNPKGYYMRNFIIARPDGTIEMTLEIPWSASSDSEEGKSYYSWAFGNWGELYAFIYPPYDSNHSWRNSKKEIELAVSRNYLKYFGILNDDRIRLRKGPGTDTESLGTYPIKTGFKILEKSGVKQTIGGVTDEWIKVRLLDGTEGYFFGQYVQNLYDGPGTSLPWPNVADWD